IGVSVPRLGGPESTARQLRNADDSGFDGWLPLERRQARMGAGNDIVVHACTNACTDIAPLACTCVSVGKAVHSGLWTTSVVHFGRSSRSKTRRSEIPQMNGRFVVPAFSRIVSVTLRTKAPISRKDRGARLLPVKTKTPNPASRIACRWAGRFDIFASRVIKSHSRSRIPAKIVSSLAA